MQMNVRHRYERRHVEPHPAGRGGGGGGGGTHRGEPEAVSEHHARHQRHLAGRLDGVQVEMRHHVKRRPVEAEPGRVSPATNTHING